MPVPVFLCFEDAGYPVSEFAALALFLVRGSQGWDGSLNPVDYLSNRFIRPNHKEHIGRQ
jgi:hypothetical protein